MVLPGQPCHVGPAVLSGTVNLYGGQGSGVVAAPYGDQTVSHRAQIEVHPPLVHGGTLEKQGARARAVRRLGYVLRYLLYFVFGETLAPDLIYGDETLF